MSFGSLTGVDTGGKVREADPNGASRFLLFVIRAERAANDVEFWNKVVRQVAAKSASIDYWGICDSGAECDEYQSVATFAILGHLNPYQMRIVAEAHEESEVLLYDESNTLVSRIGRVPDASTMATRIVQEGE